MRKYIKKRAELLLLPLITDDAKRSHTWFGGLQGVYIQDTNKPQWENKIILVYKQNTANIYSILNYKSSKYTYETYWDNKNKETYEIYAYIIPPQYKNDYNLIISGQYSKLSPSTKARIKSFWENPRLKHKKNCYIDVLKILNPETILETKSENGEILESFGTDEILDLNEVIKKG